MRPRNESWREISPTNCEIVPLRKVLAGIIISEVLAHHLMKIPRLQYYLCYREGKRPFFDSVKVWCVLDFRLSGIGAPEEMEWEDLSE